MPRTPNFPDGFSLHGVNVWRLDSDSRASRGHPETHPETRTGADGRYVMAGLQPGTHRVEVIAAGLAYDRRHAVAVRDGETTELEHVLEDAGVLQGVDRRGGYLGLTREGAEQPLLIAILARSGQFTFPGLSAGRYEIARFHSTESRGSVPLQTVEIVAGRTTWVDLRDAERPVRITGRVVDARGPLPGVRVLFYPEWQRTDGGGRFQFGADYALTGWVSFRVLVDDVTTTFEFPGMREDERTWERDLVLGSHGLTVRTLGAEGLPAPAVLDFQTSYWVGRDDGVEGVSAEDLAVGPSGELELDRLPAGDFTFTARFEGGAETTARLELPAAGPLELRAPRVGVLVVEVRDLAGQPLPGWRAGVATWVGDGEAPAGDEAFLEHVAYRDGTTDASGEVRIEGVTAGELHVAVEPGGMGFFLVEEREGWSQRAALAPGEERRLAFAVEPPGDGR